MLKTASLSFQYDWLGNTTSTGDDANGFYDRSLGTVTNGTSTAGPYQLTAANGGTGTRGGTLTAVYDAAGNLSSMAVNRSGPCSPLAQSCNQRFGYDWDEVGRLVQARRWDQLLGAGTASSPLPTTTANVRLQYTYDSSDGRVLKTAIDPLGNKLFTAYILGSLELRRAAISGTNDYTRNNATEVPYLSAHGVRLARVHYAEELIPAPIGQSQHVLYEMPDHLGSTSIVVDGASGEVVERGSYLAYGQADSDYRPTRWGSFREDYRFTGKEEDVEVGLQYFGKRFYAPGLNRWVSADPLAVHALGSDLNAYAYVHASILRATDPQGLDGGKPEPPASNPASAQAPQVPGRSDSSLTQDVKAYAGFLLNRAWEWLKGPVTPQGGATDIAEKAGARVESGVDEMIDDPEMAVAGMLDKADELAHKAEAAGALAQIATGGGGPPAAGPGLVPSPVIGGSTAAGAAPLAAPAFLAKKGDEGAPSREGHTATWELKSREGEVRATGTKQSGSDTPPGRRLTFTEQLQVHTEPKILDEVRVLVKPGDTLSIEGTRPPCNPGGRGCMSAMQSFADEHQVTIHYTQKDVESWFF